jgi:hypothetical protein
VCPRKARLHTYARYAHTHTHARGVQLIHTQTACHTDIRAWYPTHTYVNGVTHTYKRARRPTHTYAKRAHTYIRKMRPIDTYANGVPHIHTRVVSNINKIAWFEHTYDPRFYVCPGKVRLHTYAQCAHTYIRKMRPTHIYAQGAPHIRSEILRVSA